MNNISVSFYKDIIGNIQRLERTTLRELIIHYA